MVIQLEPCMPADDNENVEQEGTEEKKEQLNDNNALKFMISKAWWASRIEWLHSQGSHSGDTNGRGRNGDNNNDDVVAEVANTNNNNDNGDDDTSTAPMVVVAKRKKQEQAKEAMASSFEIGVIYHP